VGQAIGMFDYLKDLTDGFEFTSKSLTREKKRFTPLVGGKKVKAHIPKAQNKIHY